MKFISMHLITDEQREYLLSMDLKQRQKEILKKEYLNGEYYADDVGRIYAGDLPDADCWCFGFPCQDISIAGKQLGFTGNRSSLFFRVMYLANQLEEDKKPEWLFIENVKNLLSVNRGWDFARLLTELDKAGYDAEWDVLNSKDFGVPQNRERCFIIGHLRSRGGREVFPLPESNAEATELQGQQDRVLANSLLAGDRDANGTYPIIGGGGTQSEWVPQAVIAGNSEQKPKKTNVASCLCSGSLVRTTCNQRQTYVSYEKESSNTGRSDIRNRE